MAKSSTPHNRKPDNMFCTKEYGGTRRVKYPLDLARRHLGSDRPSAHAVTPTSDGKTQPQESDPPPTPVLTTKQLIIFLGNLPQELYDEIQALVLSIDGEPRLRVLKRDYKEPVQLQLNHKLRTELLEKYYGSGAFWSVSYRNGDEYPRNDYPQSFVRWRNSRSREVRCILEEAGKANTFFSPRYGKRGYHWHEERRDWPWSFSWRPRCNGDCLLHWARQ